MSIINDEDILKVIINYNVWWKTGRIPKEAEKDMKRTVFKDANKAFLDKEIRRFVILTGARRVGKTIILYQQIQDLLNNGVEPKNILYISLDNPILKLSKLNKILELYELQISGEGEKYIFLDEVQYAEDWDTWLKVLYDQNNKIHIMATGSASPIIKQGAAESGAGRWVTITVPTLSFYEYCKLKSTQESEIEEQFVENIKIEELDKMDEKELGELVIKLSSLQKHFNRYIKIGGFPELALSSNDEYAQRILREDIVDKVLKRDMPALFAIRNISVLEKVFIYLCIKSSNIVNYSNMSKDLENTSIATIQDYIMYLKNANLIYESNPINNQNGKVLKSNPKVYVVDSAIRNAVLMKDDVITDFVELGYSVETAVYRHLYTYIKNYNGTVGYYRDSKKNKEIDIVGKSLKTNFYVEVKYRERTQIDKDNPLYNLPDKNDKIFVITREATDYGIITKDEKKIIKIPAFAFLYLLG